LGAASLSAIVALPEPSPIVASAGCESSMPKLSSFSSSASSVIGTLTCSVVSPGANVTVPLAPV
jgi:hypothetical protein